MPHRYLRAITFFRAMCSGNLKCRQLGLDLLIAMRISNDRLVSRAPNKFDLVAQSLGKAFRAEDGYGYRNPYLGPAHPDKENIGTPMCALICPVGVRSMCSKLEVRAEQTSGFPPSCRDELCMVRAFRVIIPRRVEPRRHRQRMHRYTLDFAALPCPRRWQCLAVLGWCNLAGDWESFQMVN